MKALIENLKSMIEIEKQEFESHKKRESRLRNLSFEAMKNHERLARHLFELASEEYDKKQKSYRRLTSLRKALANLRDADGQIEGTDYSIFEPEFDIQK